jgi:hypothetical protein
MEKAEEPSAANPASDIVGSSATETDVLKRTPAAGLIVIGFLLYCQWDRNQKTKGKKRLPD